MVSQTNSNKGTGQSLVMAQIGTKKLPMFNGVYSEVLRKICLEEGADDVGFVEIDRKALGSGKVKIQGNLKLFKKFQGCFVGQ